MTFAVFNLRLTSLEVEAYRTSLALAYNGMTVDMSAAILMA